MCQNDSGNTKAASLSPLLVGNKAVEWNQDRPNHSNRKKARTQNTSVRESSSVPRDRAGSHNVGIRVDRRGRQEQGAKAWGPWQEAAGLRQTPYEAA